MPVCGFFPKVETVISAGMCPRVCEPHRAKLYFFFSGLSLWMYWPPTGLLGVCIEPPTPLELMQWGLTGMLMGVPVELCLT